MHTLYLASVFRIFRFTDNINCWMKWLRYSKSMYDNLIAIFLYNPTSLLVQMLVSWAWISCSSSTLFQEKDKNKLYEHKRSSTNTSDSTSDIKCKHKGLLTQCLALIKDSGEENQQKQSVAFCCCLFVCLFVCFFRKTKVHLSFPRYIKQSKRIRPTGHDSEREIPPCCYTESNANILR